MHPWSHGLLAIISSIFEILTRPSFFSLCGASKRLFLVITRQIPCLYLCRLCCLDRLHVEILGTFGFQKVCSDNGCSSSDQSIVDWATDFHYPIIPAIGPRDKNKTLPEFPSELLYTFVYHTCVVKQPTKHKNGLRWYETD